jgi:beta-glucanase (GH16 family)
MRIKQTALLLALFSLFMAHNAQAFSNPHTGRWISRDPAAVNFTTTATAPAYPPVGYGLVWSDEFSGTTLDISKWGYENPGKWRDGFNTPNAVSVTNGLLTITTHTENGTNFTCELNTYNKFTPKYGYVEASIDFNDSPGEWSAFWLYNYTVPNVGDPKNNGVEVDIIEHLAQNGSLQNVSSNGFSTLHWDGYAASHKSVSSGNYNFGFATGFHTCALLWTTNSYQFIMDGTVVWTTTNAPGTDPVPPLSPVSQVGKFLLLSSEVWNGNWVGNIPAGGFGSLATSTTKLKVDYVRYYQVVSGPTIALAETLTAVNTTDGTASPTPSSFRVSGSLLTGDLTVAPPSGYEVSTSIGSGYTNNLTLTPSGGTLISMLVYVRLKASATVAGSPNSGNITVSGGGATSQTMAMAASTVSERQRR